MLIAMFKSMTKLLKTGLFLRTKILIIGPPALKEKKTHCICCISTNTCRTSFLLGKFNSTVTRPGLCFSLRSEPATDLMGNG